MLESASDATDGSHPKASQVESRRGAVAWAVRHHSVSSPRSSNRTCGFPASGSPTGFTTRHTVDGQCKQVSRDDTVARDQPSPCGRALSEASGYFLVLLGSSPITDPRLLRKRARSQGPFLRRHYPASQVVRPCPTPARPAVLATALEARPPAVTGLPRLPGSPFQRAVPITPADRNGCICRLLPHSTRPSPCSQAGRHPQFHFRGLLRLHSGYGPLDRSAAYSDLCHGASKRPVTRPPRPSATSSTNNSLDGSFLHWCSAPSGRTD
jgi:hypothetical protein